MTKTQKKLNDYVWLKGNNNYGTHTFCDFYKNYCISINGYYEYYNKLEIIIHKYDEKNNNIIKVYYNNNQEEIKKCLGKKFRENSYNTLHKKIKNLINTYDL